MVSVVAMFPIVFCFVKQENLGSLSFTWGSKAKAKQMKHDSSGELNGPSALRLPVHGLRE
jgi:hypothetical protein